MCEALQDDSQAPIDAVAAVVLETPPIAARLLQAANTSIFGQQRKIATVSQAIVVLGLKMVQNIVLAAGIFEDIKTLDGKDLSAKQLWQHSIGCGSIASHLAKERGESTAVQETAMLAGILHDIGKLVLAKCLPVSYVNILREAVRQNVSIATVEREKLGTDHGAVGGILAEWWHLPPQVVDAIRFHTNPASADAELITHLVHVANVLVHQLDIGFSGTTAPPEVSAATLTRLNIELEDLGSIAETLPDLVFRVPLARDEILRAIRKKSRKAWKEKSGYHRRSLAETQMSRYKQIIGDKLRARGWANLQVESRLGCAILNRMTHLGRPESYKVEKVNSDPEQYRARPSNFFMQQRHGHM